MKTAFIVLSCLIYSNVFGQLDKLRGTWITDTLDGMTIYTSTDGMYHSSIEPAEKNHFQDYELFEYGDTLSFQNRYYSSETNYKQLYIDRYDLIVVKITDSTLLLRPCSELSQKFYGSKSEIKFIKQEFLRDATIQFEKIIYHTTTCFGSCPEIDLEIDSNKKIYLSVWYMDGSPTQTSKERSGEFEGVLSDSLYNELILLLQTCNLKTLYFPDRTGSDAPVTTLIIYFDGKRKYLKSMFPPDIAGGLIGYLYTIPDRQKLERANAKKTLEE